MRRGVFWGFVLMLSPAILVAQESRNLESSQGERALATATEATAESQTPQLPLNWLCAAKAFNKKFDALGASRAEAKFNAKELCKAQYNEMHCSVIDCEGPSSGQPLGWNCKISPFGKSFEVAASTRAEAKYKCQKLCRVEYSEMFCEDAKCTEG